jgi:hypothetical protein
MAEDCHYSSVHTQCRSRNPAVEATQLQFERVHKITVPLHSVSLDDVLASPELRAIYLISSPTCRLLFCALKTITKARARWSLGGPPVERKS